MYFVSEATNSWLGVENIVQTGNMNVRDQFHHFQRFNFVILFFLLCFRRTINLLLELISVLPESLSEEKKGNELEGLIGWGNDFL